MMSDISIRQEGVAGRITLTRPKALNALSYEMCTAIEGALDAWAEDDAVQVLIIDAEGDKAFCAGGDIAELYATGRAGDFDYGRKFWADEYRMNAKLFEFPKPVISFLQGFTMGGGVGIGCHGSHRITCESSRIAMPETGIGLIPDVGGSLLLSQCPGRIGEYLGCTSGRMTAADAIYAGFADYYVPALKWAELKSALAMSGDLTWIDKAAEPAAPSTLKDDAETIERCFGGETLGDIFDALKAETGDFAARTLATMQRNSPLSMAATIEIIHRLRGSDDIRRALELEYRFTARAMEHGDFLEGIRAAIIDKDKNPTWRHNGPDVPATQVSQMLMPLGADGLSFT